MTAMSVTAPIAFLGLPSLHSIIEAIANGFFGALASALVPSFLKHGTVATIQYLVALPDPAGWPHVGQLQGEMVWLGVLLMPVTLSVAALRYWLVGLTGQAHPVTALARCGWVTGVLVSYRWLIDQAVAATNTLTHAILGFPSVADGLARLIAVLFGGALLVGTGGVFGAFLVILGVIFAAALFAIQVLVTVVLALLIVAGPPLIAVSAIPELSHLARAWGYALLAVSLVPLAWTVLFATAGALTLDATSFTGAAGGIPGHIAAAFAGLVTFVLAVRLPLMLLGQTRHLLAGSLGAGGAGAAASTVRGSERVRVAHARLRSVALEGVPSLGRSVGRAAGALGTPPGGPAGALARTVRRHTPTAARRPVDTGGDATGRAGSHGGSVRPGVAGRVSRAAAILRGAPAEARAQIRPGKPALATGRPHTPGSARARARETPRVSSTRERATARRPASGVSRPEPAAGAAPARAMKPAGKPSGAPGSVRSDAPGATGRSVPRRAQRTSSTRPAARLTSEGPSPSAVADHGLKRREKQLRSPAKPSVPPRPPAPERGETGRGGTRKPRPGGER
jgi:hypothetical protein